MQQKAKSFAGYFLVGLLYIASASILFTILGNALGVSFDNDLGKLANAVGTLQPVPIILGIVGFIILGVLVWIFGVLSVKVRNIVTGEHDSAKFGNKPFIVTLFATGIVTSVIFFAFSQLLTGLAQNVNVLKIDSLFTALVAMNPAFILATIAGFAVIGYLVTKISQNIDKIDKYQPESFKKF